jgi:hypothetical protein
MKEDDYTLRGLTKNPNVLAAIIIGAATFFLGAATLLAPIISQSNQPALTQPPAPTPFPTPARPRITIKNKLMLPVGIFINDIYQGELDATSDDSFVLVGMIPATIRFSLSRKKNERGEFVGEEIAGSFYRVEEDQTLTIDNRVADNFYFFPKLTNNTGSNCEVYINDGPAAKHIGTLSAHQQNCIAGYFHWWPDSNVTLNCNGQLWWWGVRNGQGDSFSKLVKPESGLLELTHNP